MLKNFISLNERKKSVDTTLFTNLVFAFFPISFILGNPATNVNILLFCALGIWQLKSKILTGKFNLPIKFIFLLFCLIFFSTVLSFTKSFYLEIYEYTHLVRLIKSIVFFRFFLMIIIVYFLSEINILNFKFFFISAACASLIVAIDIIFQHIVGFNMIGLKSELHHNSGFFGNEWIAGGFLQNFSFFLILFSTFILKEKIKFRFVLITIIICILGLGIFLSGNKMPVVLFVFGLFLLFFSSYKLKRIISVSLICLFFFFKFFYTTNQNINNNFSSFYDNIDYIVTALLLKPMSKIDVGTNELSTSSEVTSNQDQKLLVENKKKFISDKSVRIRLFLTAIDIWKKNKLFGNGIKSFSHDCFKFQKKDLKISGQALPIAPLDENAIYEYNFTQEYEHGKKNRLCSNHPHNYYMEILTDTGIVGLFITLVIASLFIVFIFKNLKFLRQNDIVSFILVAATISLILAVFPFKSSGSIFTTANATYITLIASIILSCKKKVNTNSD